MRREHPNRFVISAMLLSIGSVAAWAQVGPTREFDGRSYLLGVSSAAPAALLIWRSGEPGLSRIVMQDGRLAQVDSPTPAPVSSAASADLNGDGRDDAVIRMSDRGGGFLVVPGAALRSDAASGSGVAARVDWSLEQAQIIGTADSDADGTEDIMLQTETTTTRRWSIATAQGNRLGEPFVWGSSRPDRARVIAYEDANGDGRADLWRVFDRNGSLLIQVIDSGGQSSFWFETTHLDALPFSTADANGDGLPDLWLRWDEGRTRTWAVMLNDGASFNGGTFSTSTTTPNVVEKGAADSTGDGRADLWLQYDNRGSRNWQIRQSTGSSFGAISNWFSVPSNRNVEAIGVADADGDKRADLWLLYPEQPLPTVEVRLSAGSGFARVLVAALREPGGVFVPGPDDGAEPGQPEATPAETPGEGPAAAGPLSPAVPVALERYYGYAQASGRITNLDGGYDGRFADVMEFPAQEGETLQFMVYFAQDKPFRVAFTDPAGADLNPEIDQNSRTVELPGARAGMYTIAVYTTNPEAVGDYYVYARARGEVFTGTVDPLSDRRDMGVTYDSVDLDLSRDGYYQFELMDKFLEGRMIVRDADYNDAPMGDTNSGTARVQRGVLSAGTYHIIIEDKYYGGDWSPEVTYLGPPGA